MAWFTPGPRSPTVSRPARWIIHTDGLVACPGSCRRHRPAPFRLAHVRPPAPARSGSLPGAPRLQGGGGTQACGSAGRRRRVAVLCLTVGPAARTRRRRVDAHRRADRHERADPPDCRRRAGGAVLPCRREIGSRACARGQSGGASAALVTGRAGGRATRSGGDRSCHQPVELADFLGKGSAGASRRSHSSRWRRRGCDVQAVWFRHSPARARQAGRRPGPFRSPSARVPEAPRRRMSGSGTESLSTATVRSPVPRSRPARPTTRCAPCLNAAAAPSARRRSGLFVRTGQAGG